MTIEKVELKIDLLKPNTGQIPGVPSNPRQISKTQIQSLKKSLRSIPEMLNLRPLIVVPDNSASDAPSYVTIAGNMRLLAAKELNLKSLPALILPSDTPPEKLAEIAIKDNNQWGEYDIDILANEWTDFPLADWGLPELAEMLATIPDEDEIAEPAEIEEVSSSNPDKYPVALIFNITDYRRWQDVKLKTDSKSDTEAATYLLDIWEKAETLPEQKTENTSSPATL